MEEEKKDWTEKFSKDELIEDIQGEFSNDAKNNIGCGGILLILIVMNVVSVLSTGDVSSITWSSVILLLIFVFEIWWKKKLSKCDGAQQLVDTYDKYKKQNKSFSYLLGILFFLYTCYYIYSDYGKVSLSETLVWAAIAILIFGIIIWALFYKRDKLPVEKEIDRLRQLLDQK